MNERQRNHFLWLWSQRRSRGANTVALRGALIGAGGGLLFSMIMLSSMGAPASAGYTGLAALLPMLQRAGLLLAMTVPAMACACALGARRLYALHEFQYQSLLLQGARVPTAKPVLQTADHAPAIAVAVVAGVIGLQILALAIAVHLGRL